MRFALPVADVEIIEDHVYTFAGLVCSGVRNEPVGCATVSNVFLKDVGKMGFRFHAVHITDMSSTPKEDLVSDRTCA
jgi:hypothetical protein